MRRGSRTSQCCLGAVVAVVLSTSIARAQEETQAAAQQAADPPLASAAKSAPLASASNESAASGSQLEAAAAAFWEAHRRFEAADYAAALEFFEESYALFPQPELVFNIALTHERLGNCAAALETYERYLSAPGARAAGDSDRALNNRAELAKRCELPPPPPAPDEPVVLTTPVPGVTAMKRAPSESAPSTPPAALSDSGVATSSESQLQTQLGWAALGAAAVSLGAVVYFDVQRRAARSENSQAQSEYRQGLTPADEVIETESRFYRSRSLEIAMGVISGVLAATGSALLLYHPSPTSDEAVRAKSQEFGLGMTWVSAF